MKERETCIHASAVVMRGAELDAGVTVGPYTVIGPRVRVGRDTWIGPHAVVEGNTVLGKSNRVFQFASVGAIPQDLKYRGEDSSLTIGDRNTIREFATLNPGTEGGGMVTRVGNGNLLMVYSHVAHDCQIGDHTILANGASLGGHVTLEDYVVVGALVGVHQFVRVGESAFLGAGAMVSMDVPPYCRAVGDRAHLYGLNVPGLKRRGFSPSVISELRRGYRTLFLSGLPLREAVRRIRENGGLQSPEMRRLVAFAEGAPRGVCRPRRRGPTEDAEHML